MLCKHGCGKEAIYKDRCDKLWNKCPSLKRKNSEGLKRAHAEGRLSVSSFDGKRGWSKNKTALSDARLVRSRMKNSLRTLVENSEASPGFVRKYLLFHKIIIDNCNHSEWNGKRLNQQLHHKNGIKNDMRKENLSFLCPNCHSQTENYGFKNHTHSEESILKGLKTSGRVRRKNALVVELGDTLALDASG